MAGRSLGTVSALGRFGERKESQNVGAKYDAFLDALKQFAGPLGVPLAVSDSLRRSKELDEHIESLFSGHAEAVDEILRDMQTRLAQCEEAVQKQALSLARVGAESCVNDSTCLALAKSGATSQALARAVLNALQAELSVAGAGRGPRPIYPLTPQKLVDHLAQDCHYDEVRFRRHLRTAQFPVHLLPARAPMEDTAMEFVDLCDSDSVTREDVVQAFQTLAHYNPGSKILAATASLVSASVTA